MAEIQTVDDLRNTIQTVVVKDFGDFKRKTVTYLNRYSENKALTEEQQKHVFFIKWHVQFHPNLDVAETKRWVLRQISKL